jgi:predicted RNA binding protein YcfA (HicA-like mRNA interferase family)
MKKTISNKDLEAAVRRAGGVFVRHRGSHAHYRLKTGEMVTLVYDGSREQSIRGLRHTVGPLLRAEVDIQRD